ncbi:MAG: hypothetical protein ACRBI6_09635 [Acidimicrobiales bacterium]
MKAPSTYEIVLRGRVGERLLRPLLDDFVVELDADTTRLVGDVRDASHLHGVLTHLTSVTAEVLSVRQLPDPSDPPHGRPARS